MFKNRFAFALLLLAVIGGAYCGGAQEPPAPVEPPPPPPLTATAELSPTEGNDVTGTVSFEESNGMVTVVAHVMGLSPGLHGIHIHETGDCSAPDGSSAGGHFNPGGTDHGAPDGEMHHAGDLGNIEADVEGHGQLEITVDYITLSEGMNSVMNRAVIIHENPDTFAQPTGDAGGRLACGVIMSGMAGGMMEEMEGEMEGEMEEGMDDMDEM